ncbi:MULTISPECIES: MlaD family protein [unclassified Nocardioides]|uniref:MlaD family protein n=1 Tax=unclassified Nocardioides TaxID=2615069 RepID=UPI000702A0E0|nr:MULTISPECIES: MlaD family protein [unclassified Nocardioides]KRC46458.1 hypothetical protein ASE19_21790 [Nocardioides sp. Root79]KRC69802.1 hypothetical protein ASE20_14640 [Nocardioides sp. Root240]
MRIPHALEPRLRLGVLVGFVSACALIFGYLWVNMGGSIPALTSDGYRVVVPIKDGDNVVFDSDVRVAGVAVGKVRGIDVKDSVAMVTLQFDDDDVIPLHEGASVHLRAKSMVEETYLEVIDGKGEVLANGDHLPEESVAEPVQLHDVLTSLDAPTRASLGRTLRALGKGTKGTEEDVAALMNGLGDLGDQGYDVLDALADQSKDLDDMTRSLGVVLRSLDHRQGEIVDLVESADQLTTATAANHKNLEATVRQLPGLVDSAREASGDLTTLATSLAPIAKDLRTASPGLTTALRNLPSVTADVKGLLPSLDVALDRAPATLSRVDDFGSDVSSIVPEARVALADVNPVLAYVAPYKKDLTAFFTNWAAMMANSDANGHYLRVFMVFNETSLKGLPFKTHVGVLDKRNSYPAPGGALNPGPFNGTYPRIEELPE